MVKLTKIDDTTTRIETDNGQVIVPTADLKDYVAELYKQAVISEIGNIDKKHFLGLLLVDKKMTQIETAIQSLRFLVDNADKIKDFINLFLKK